MKYPHPTRDTMNCRCGNEFGRAYYLDGVFVGAQIGALIVDTLHGRCPQCGRGIHIQVSTKEMIKLFSHYTEASLITVEISE